MGTPEEHRRLGPGLHVRTDVDPVERALELAVELGADLCATVEEADDVLAERQALPALTADELRNLGALADRVAAAQRILGRTLDRAATGVGERLAATGAGLAVHPSAVRDRAAAVVTARAALAAREEELNAATEALVVPEPPAATMVSTVAAAPPSEVEPPVPRRRGFLGFGRRPRARAYAEDTSESTSLLRQLSASTDEAFGARRANAARSDEVLLLQARRDRAEEDLRVAARAWQELAGEDPVEDVELVVRRFDPQHQDALAVAEATVGARAASALVERAQERWEQACRAAGLDGLSSGDQPAFDQMSERLTRPVVLVSDAVDRADLIAVAAPAAPVVALLERSVS